MSTHQVSYRRAAKKSMTEESGRPGTCRSKVGCEAMEEPCTNRIRPAVPDGSPACLFHRKSFAPSSLCAQCSVPMMRSGLFMQIPSLALDGIRCDDLRPLVDLGADVRTELLGCHRHRLGTLPLPGALPARPEQDLVHRLVQALADR